MTGMPAWGPSHKDEELWNIVAFVKALPTMSGSDYQVLDEYVSKGHGHSGGGLGDEESEHGNDGHGH